MTTSVLERFLRYVQIDTRSDERSRTVPTTPGQLVLLRHLVDELHALGVSDASMDEHGYVMATIPATPGCDSVPVIGFLAHVDTSPEMPGKDVRPIVHAKYDGRDLVLPDDPSAVLRAAEDPALAGRIGDDIVTASGLTLLGADDKAGVAAIMAAVEVLMTSPGLSHGAIRVGFTPDEEVGRGADHFDVAAFGAVCAYTLDGGGAGELEYESFSADAISVTFKGFNTHPGYAKGRMVNAIKLAADFISRLPAETLSPETTAGYESYVHPYQVDASVDRTSVRLLVRDFVTAGLKEKEAFVERLAQEVIAPLGSRAGLEIAIEESYRNMREVLDRHPEVIARARVAIRRAGLEPIERPIRGGTDGSRLSFMGLPTPNLFTGEHSFHSRLEWTSRGEMEKAVDVIVGLSGVWAEEGSEKTEKTLTRGGEEGRIFNFERRPFLRSSSPPHLPVRACLRGLLPSQTKVHRHRHDDRDDLAVHGGRRELPLLDGLERSLVEQRNRPENLGALDTARCAYDRLDDDDALHARILRHGRVHRWHVLDLRWHFDVAADANRRHAVDELDTSRWWRRWRWRWSASAHPHLNAGAAAAHQLPLALLQLNRTRSQLVGFGYELRLRTGVRFEICLVPQQYVLHDHCVDVVRLQTQGSIFGGDSRLDVSHAVGSGNGGRLSDNLLVERRCDVLRLRIRRLHPRRLFDCAESFGSLSRPLIQPGERHRDDRLARKRRPRHAERRFGLFDRTSSFLQLRQLEVRSERRRAVRDRGAELYLTTRGRPRLTGTQVPRLHLRSC